MDDQGKTARSVSNCQLYMAFSHATSSSFILTPSSRICLLSIPHFTVLPACGTLEKHVVN